VGADRRELIRNTGLDSRYKDAGGCKNRDAMIPGQGSRQSVSKRDHAKVRCSGELARRADVLLAGGRLTTISIRNCVVRDWISAWVLQHVLKPSANQWHSPGGNNNPSTAAQTTRIPQSTSYNYCLARSLTQFAGLLWWTCHASPMAIPQNAAPVVPVPGISRTRDPGQTLLIT
jgi:hypothetical protein